MKTIDGSISKLKGFKFGSVACGIKKSGKRDLSVIYSNQDCSVAGMFTQNRFMAAPVIVDKEKLKKKNTFRALVVNSGNANSCTGSKGIEDANLMCELVGNMLKLDPEQILVCSTGIIGQPLPMGKIRNCIDKIRFDNLEKNFLEGIMTTDAFEKKICVELSNGSRIAGIAKGAGMISPNLATLLCFIFTDAKVSARKLEKTLKNAVDKSFNMISVDGDASTNDTILAFSSGLKGKLKMKEFREGFEFVTRELAKMVVKDGEGATKLLEVRVSGANSEEDAKKAVKSVINSLLVKTAMFGQDPNWGRIVCALGYSSAFL
jgi:glutamate N-acetyltransferase/amino-acid N-acetyltransferase